MRDPTQDLRELLLHPRDLTHRQRAIVELPVRDLGGHDRFDERLHTLRGRLAPGARCGLARIREHDDRGLLGAGPGAGVGIARHVQLALRLLTGLLVEEPDLLGAVVLENEIDHDLRHLGLPREPHPFRHVLTNDRRRSLRLELVVRVPPFRLVLHEVVGLQHLAHVVVEHPDPAQEPVGPDLGRCGFREIRDVDGVRIGAGGLHRQPTQERAGRIRPFEEGLIGGDTGEELEHPQEPHRQQGGYRGVARENGPTAERHHEITPRCERMGDQDEARRERDDRDGYPCFGSTTHRPHAHRGGRPPGDEREHGAVIREGREGPRDDRDQEHEEQRHARVPKHRDRKGHERDRKPFGGQPAPVDGDTRPEIRRDEQGDEQDPPEVGVHLRSVEEQQQPEDAEDHRVQ